MSGEAALRRAPHPSGETPAFVALGSNLGDRLRHLRGAVRALQETAGIRALRRSPIFETDPVGPPPQGPYLNAVVALQTSLTPRSLLKRLQAIERDAGRSRSVPDAARSLDLDLLFFGDACIDEPGLVVPHPRLHQRAFVLEPLAHLAPELRHPLLGIRVSELAKRVRDEAAVRLFEAEPEIPS